MFFEVISNDMTPLTQRIIIGLKPNMRDNQYASLLTLKYISQFISKVEKDIDAFSKEYNMKPNNIKNIIDLYKHILTYHSKKSDVSSMSYYLEAVVNSKLIKSGDYLIKPTTLTGDNTLNQIKNTITKIERYYDNPSNKKSLFAVFATSVVSHGVDIDKWNIMIFQGMPRSTSEYIQALSRVGRKYLGIVFVWFYPNRARDLSFYQNFKEYHERLQHRVEFIPISRWARLGLEETFTSIFNAAILNYFSDVFEKSIYKIDTVNEIFSSADEKKTEENRRRLIEFIQKVYMIDSGELGSRHFSDEIPSMVEKRLDYLVNYHGAEKNFFPNALADNSNKYFKTQYGMRGIQRTVRIVPEYRDFKILRKYKGGEI